MLATPEDVLLQCSNLGVLAFQDLQLLSIYNMAMNNCSSNQGALRASNVQVPATMDDFQPTI